MAGRAMCAGGSGPLFAPGTRRGREAGCPAIASAACGASSSGGGASCSGGGASVVGVVECGTYALPEGLWQR